MLLILSKLAGHDRAATCPNLSTEPLLFPGALLEAGAGPTVPDSEEQGLPVLSEGGDRRQGASRDDSLTRPVSTELPFHAHTLLPALQSSSSLHFGKPASEMPTAGDSPHAHPLPSPL